MTMTAFDPARFGFAFVNSFETLLIADWRFAGLCGGMSYAAADYFHAGVEPGRESSRPADGTPLFQYIYDRQRTSVLSNLDKWLELIPNPFGWRTDEFFRWGLDKSPTGRVTELGGQIDAGNPVPLGLFHEGGGGIGVAHHQVLAVGYDGIGMTDPDDAVRIYLYDPNHPNEVRCLRPDLEAHRWFLEGGSPNERWITYFVDLKYRPQQPPAPDSENPLTNGLVSALIVAITTGGDDLRGGNDNLDVAVRFSTGNEAEYQNVNNNARWIDNYQQTVVLPVNPAVPETEIAEVQLRTYFGGGLGGDNWNVNDVTITDNNGRLLGHVSGNPWVRFTGDVHTAGVPVHA